MPIDTFGIILEMVVMLPLVWLVLFLCRKKLFPKDLPKEERLKKSVTILIIAALAVGAFGRTLIKNLNSADMNDLGVFSFLFLVSQVASFLMILGCGNLAYKKGHHWGWGFLGTFSLLGLLVIAFFRDRSK
jgi:hypothetical protein